MMGAQLNKVEDVQLNLLVQLQMSKQHVTFQNMEIYAVGMIPSNNVEINHVLISMGLNTNPAINK